MRDVLGKNWSKHVVKSLSYEVTDPTIDSQITELQASGADVVLVAATPKFAAQAIRKVHDLNWKPMFFMTNVSISVGSVMKPAGERERRSASQQRLDLKDPTDAVLGRRCRHEGVARVHGEVHAGADMTDDNYVTATPPATSCGRCWKPATATSPATNVMKQATSIKNLEVRTLLPGIKVNTSPTNYHPIRAMQLHDWDGKTWVRFGEHDRRRAGLT